MIKNIINKLKKAGENDKIVYKNVLGAFLVKGFALLVTLFTLPSYIRFFNNDEVLGLWYTVLSLLNWILNFDLGIGNGLRNHLSESLSKGTKDDTKKYISSAYISVGAIVIFLSAIFPLLISKTNHNGLLNIDEAVVSAEDLYIVAVIVFVGVMLQFWLRLISSVLYALQKSSINNFLVLITNIIILVFAAVFPSRSNGENVIIMAIVHAIAVALPLLTATFFVFCGKLRYAVVRIKYFTLEHTKKVLSLGGVFFFVQIAYLIIMSTNEFLITKIAGNEFGVDYQAYYKIFSLGSTVFALALTPIWSVITKAQAENNIKWIQSTYKKFMLLGIIFCAGEFAVAFITEPIMTIWLGAENVPKIKFIYSMIFALLGSAMVINGVLSSIANGTGRLKTQAICFGIGAILKVPLSYAFVDICGSWIGVVLANVVSMGLYCIAQPIVFRRYFKTNK